MSATDRPAFVPSAGTVLKYGNYGCATPATLVANVRTLPDIFDLKAQTWETSEIDAVDGSGNPDWNQYFEAGKVAGGELTFKIGGNFTQAGTLCSMVGKGQSFAWGIFFANGGNVIFNGPLSELKGATGEKDELSFQATVMASGSITINPPGGQGRSVSIPTEPAKESADASNSTASPLPAAENAQAEPPGESQLPGTAADPAASQREETAAPETPRP